MTVMVSLFPGVKLGAAVLCVAGDGSLMVRWRWLSLNALKGVDIDGKGALGDCLCFFGGRSNFVVFGLQLMQAPVTANGSGSSC